MKLDQYMKEFSVEFLVEVVKLFFPEIAQKLDFDRRKDLNKQLYTDSPKGTTRSIDILIEVATKRSPPDAMLIEIESQQQNRFDFPARMLGYHAMIYVREMEAKRQDNFSLAEFEAWQDRKQILSFVLCNYPLAQGISVKKYQIGESNIYLSCEYTCISLPVLSAREYLQKDNIAVAALATMMSMDGMSPHELKIECYRKIIPYRTTLTDRQTNFLVHAIENFLVLSEEEQQLYQQKIKELFPEVKTMLTNPLIERGRELGVEQGVQQGIQQGMQRTLLGQMQLKFGDLSENIIDRVKAIDDIEILDKCLARIITANCLQDMGIEEV